VKEMEPAVRILLGPFGKMTVDESSGFIIVSDDKESLEDIRALIAKLDRPPKTMLVEVEFIEESQVKSLGVDIKWRASGAGWTVGTSPDSGQGLSANAVAGSSDAKSSKRQFLRLLENRPGRIFVGESVPFADYLFHYGARHGYIGANTVFKDAGTSFSVKAKTVVGSQILVSLEPEVSYYDRTKNVFQVKNASLTAVVNDPGSLIIGGNYAEGGTFGANFFSGFGGRAENSRFVMILNVRTEK
jgi:type II secretory pathway component GspD/PulD (secretin)